MPLEHSAERIASAGVTMGRRKPCCSAEGLRRGAWTAEEDRILRAYVKTHGEGKWRSLPHKAGLERCGKSCRLRWLNYLRPDIKRGNITLEEEDLIIRLHRLLGNRWSLIAGRIPGRTDNEIKNYWNTCLKKKVESADRSISSREKPTYSATMISNLHHFTGGNAEIKLVQNGQFAKPDTARELLAPDQIYLTPREENWWDLLMSLDASNDRSAVQNSCLDFISLCGDESPASNNYFEEMMASPAQAKFDFELETVASFFSREQEY